MGLLTSRGIVAATVVALAVSCGRVAAQAPPARVLGLRGAPNFRDLGGYATEHGRHVRWGIVFRSDALSLLTPADEARVDGLHIRSEVDLRSRQERAAAPDLWLHPPADIYESPKPSIASVTGPRLASVRDGPTARAWMQAFYARIPDAYRGEYAELFHRLAAGREPLLIHCTAGKDRTGVASAILLLALGVPRQTVVADYTLTEALLPPSPGAASLAGLPADARLELSRAEGGFVLAALRSIDAEYGSVDFYLRTGLGLREAEISRLRERLTD